MQTNLSQAAASTAANEETVQWSATELSRRIHAHDVSRMEVMEAFPAQIDCHNPTVDAVVTRTDAEPAIDQARERDVLPS